MKFIKNLILIMLLVVGGWWVLSKLNLVPSLGALLAPKAVQIDETATIVKTLYETSIKPLRKKFAPAEPSYKNRFL